MILAIASHSQAAGFDSGKAQPNGFSQGGGINVRDPVLVADAAVGKIKPLSGDIAIWIRSVVGGKPLGEGGDMCFTSVGIIRSTWQKTHQAWTKICFARSEALVVVAARTLAASFSRA